MHNPWTQTIKQYITMFQICIVRPVYLFETMDKILEIIIYGRLGTCAATKKDWRGITIGTITEERKGSEYNTRNVKKL